MGKTITTYLINGESKGLKSIFISNRTCNALFVPRLKLIEAKNREELKRPSLYLLLGEDNKVYVGETENFIQRIQDHDYKKDFWIEALIFSSKDNFLTKADVKYLEYLVIKEIKNANTFILEGNKQNPKKPNLPEHQKDCIEDFFEDIKLLSSFIGYSLFDVIEEKNEHLFFCKNNLGTDAKGFLFEKGFRVLAGSKVRVNVVNSYDGFKNREEILSKYAIKENGCYILNKDIEFKSPSSASSFCLGNSSNGWNDWKDKENKTLNEVFRGVENANK
jgi:hypothetical protein